MSSFLVVHVLHQLLEVRMGLQNWGLLSSVYQHCREFSGMVDSQLGFVNDLIFSMA
jgi:hypothetical protein